MKKSRSYLAIPPGASIKEQLIQRGMRQKEFAVRMGLSEKHVSKLINGEVQLTIEVARKLEMVLGVPAQFWCNLEAIYREDIAKVEEENTMEAEIAIAKNMPYKKMAEKGWIVDVINEKATNYEQKSWVDRMIWRAKTICEEMQKPIQRNHHHLLYGRCIPYLHPH